MIADSLTVESYEDDSAPDTRLNIAFMLWTTGDGVRLLTRWIRVIWGIPDGIEPRVPAKLEASDTNIEGCLLSWSTGRFATSYKVYKNGTFYKEVTNKEFLDYAASVTGKC